MLRALVTGAGGFIGRHVVTELRRRGVEVRTLQLRNAANEMEARFRLDDHRESERLTDLLDEAAPDAILHLAGTADTRFLYDINVGYAARLIDGVRRAGLPATILLAGSAAEYGVVDEAELPVTERCPCRPVAPYGISKHAQTLMGLAAEAAGSRVIVARLFNVVGEGMPRHLPLMDIASRLAGSEATRQLTVGDLDIERDFVDVTDVARSLAGLAFCSPPVRGVVNICSGQGSWLRSLIERMTACVPWTTSLVAEERLLRPDTVHRMVGCPDKLVELGFPVPPPAFGELLPAIVGEAMRHGIPTAWPVRATGKHGR